VLLKTADKKKLIQPRLSIENISVNLQKAVIASEDGSLFTTDLILSDAKSI
jgi:membrane peptidoglycan carboxypeptidase